MENDEFRNTIMDRFAARLRCSSLIVHSNHLIVRDGVCHDLFETGLYRCVPGIVRLSLDVMTIVSAAAGLMATRMPTLLGKHACRSGCAQKRSSIGCHDS